MTGSAGPAIEAARSERRAALVGYLPAGFPDVETSITLIQAMVDGGCDVIEVGLPYSDPRDGRSDDPGRRGPALLRGMRTRDVFRVVEATAGRVPTLVMTYWNPVERYGVERFAADLAAAGGSGLITPDLTPDEAGEWIAAADRHNLDKVFRGGAVLDRGAAGHHDRGVPRLRLRDLPSWVSPARGNSRATSLRRWSSPTVRRTEKPACVGIGVSNGGQAAGVAAFADGAIVGSAFVKAVDGAEKRRGRRGRAGRSRRRPDLYPRRN